MISAVVYSSCTGSCKRYAETAAAALHVPAYEVGKCPALSGREVVFVGWLMAGHLQGYKAVAAKADVKTVVQVGMAPVTADSENGCREKNGISPDTKVFCLQGAFHLNALPLPMRAAMVLMNKSIAKRLHAKAAQGPLNEQEQATLHMAETGDGDPASWDGIQAVVDWVKAL